MMTTYDDRDDEWWNSGGRDPSDSDGFFDGNTFDEADQVTSRTGFECASLKTVIAIAALATSLLAAAPAQADNTVCAPFYGSGNTVCHNLDTNVYTMCGPGIAGGCVEVPRSAFGLMGPPVP
jgi:hypothetical protein